MTTENAVNTEKTEEAPDCTLPGDEMIIVVVDPDHDREAKLQTKDFVPPEPMPPVKKNREYSDQDILLLYTGLTLQINELQERRRQCVLANARKESDIVGRKIHKLLKGVRAFRTYLDQHQFEAGQPQTS